MSLETAHNSTQQSTEQTTVHSIHNFKTEHDSLQSHITHDDDVFEKNTYCLLILHHKQMMETCRVGQVILQLLKTFSCSQNMFKYHNNALSHHKLKHE